MSGNRISIGAALALLTFVACAAFFAANQSIWVDETTQLSGLTLDFAEQYLWLTGQSDVTFGVPPDRMPPISYWIGGIWASIFGLTETTMRWLGIFALACVSPLIFKMGDKTGGKGAALFLCWLILCAPSTVVLAGDIRTYPIFLALGIVATWAFAGLLFRKDKHLFYLVIFTMSLIVMSYAHYFGVVAAGCMFIGLLVQRLMTRQPIGQILGAAGVGLVSIGGLFPFITAAVDVSGHRLSDVSPAPNVLDILTDMARLFVRLFTHTSHFVSLPLLGIMMLSVLTVAIFGWIRRIRQGEGAEVIAVVLPLVVAFLALGALKLRNTGFETLSGSYNLWMVPVAALGLALAFRNWETAGQRYKQVVGIASSLIIACNLIALGIVLTHRDLYSHSGIEDAFAELSPADEVLVVHDSQTAWGHSYFPLRFLTQGAQSQWLITPEGQVSEITPNGLVPVPDPLVALASFQKVVLVQTHALSARQRGEIVRGAKRCGDVVAEMAPKGAGTSNYCAAIAVEVSPFTLK